MNKFVRIAVLVLGLVMAATAFARGDIRDDRAWVKPEKGDRFSINGYTMGKVELYGYLGQLRDDEHIKGVVIRHGGSDAQTQAVFAAARSRTDCSRVPLASFSETELVNPFAPFIALPAVGTT